MDPSLCEDASYIFGNFSNLYNCDNKFYSWPRESNPFTRTVWNCVNDYCENPDPSLEGCEGWNGGPFDFYVNPTYFYSESVCVGINKDPNADVAGPGVYISYLIQLGIVFYIFLFLRAFHLIPKVFSRITKKPTKPTLYFTRNNLALKSVLVEFQEAQCWFMLAAQCAILAAQFYNRVFEANTLQMLWTNQGLSSMVSSAGILPVVVAMWSLQRWHRSSPWIFFLSCATLILSEVTLYMLRWPEPDHLTPLESNQFPATCGGHAPPLMYCVNTDEATSLMFAPVAFFSYLNPLCLAIWAVTVLLWMWTYVGENTDTASRRWAVFNRLRLLQFHAWGQRLLESRSSRWIRLFLRAISFLIELLLVIAVCLDAVCFWKIRRVGSIDFGAWSFGQLIAITLWLPVVSKYFLILGGVESYSHSRFPRPYKIVKDRDDDHAEKIGGSDGDVQFTLLPTSTDRVNDNSSNSNSNLKGRTESDD